MDRDGTREGSPPSDSALVLRIIHIALMSGVLIFAAVVYFLMQEGVAAAAAQQASLFRWVWLALALGLVFGAGILRGRLPRGAAPERVRTTAILVWALAEATALTGITFALITGDWMPLIGGLLVGLFLFLHHRPSTF